MLRRFIVAGVIASLSVLTVGPGAAAADPIKDCDFGICVCGQEVAVGHPGKDPIYSFRVDC